jgi:hypothetical protein
MRIVQLMTDQSRYFNPSKNYWFSFNAFLISLIGLYQIQIDELHAEAPFGRAVLTRTTRKDKHRKYRPISEMRNPLKLN